MAKIKLTNEDLDQIRAALQALAEPSHKTGWNYRNRERSVMNLARSLRAAHDQLRDFDNACTKIKIRLAFEQGRSNPGKTNFTGMPDWEHLARYNEELAKIADTEVEVEFFPIGADDLNLSENNIPASIIAPLLGTVIQEPAAA